MRKPKLKPTIQTETNPPRWVNHIHHTRLALETAACVCIIAETHLVVFAGVCVVWCLVDTVLFVIEVCRRCAKPTLE